MTELCKRFENSLIELVYDELPEVEADELRMHAANCVECRNSLEGLLLTRKLTATLHPDEAGDDLDAAILDAAAKSVAGNVPSERSSTQAPKANAILPAPGFWDYFRGLVLRPAFAGTALVVLVACFTFYIVDNSQAPFHREPESSVPHLPLEGSDNNVAQSTRSVGQWEEGADVADEKETEKSPHSQGTPKPEGEVEAVWANRQPSSNGETRAIEKSQSRVARRPEARSYGKGGSGLGFAGTGSDLPSSKKRPRISSKIEAKSKTMAASDDSLGGAFSKPPPEKAPTGSDLTSVAGAGLSSEGLSPKKARKQGGSEEAEPQIPRERAQPLMDGAENEIQSASADSSHTRGQSEFDRGVEAFSRGDCRSAVTFFENVVNSNVPASNRASALHHIARCEKRRGRFGSAAGRYDKLLADYPTYPKRPDALFEAANCRIRLGQNGEARKLLESLLNFPAWRNRANRELERLPK